MERRDDDEDGKKQVVTSSTSDANSKEGEKNEDHGESEEYGDKATGKEKPSAENICPSFGIKSYHHQFYVPQPVKNPDLYEFPQMNLIYNDEGNYLTKTTHDTIFLVVVLSGIIMTIVSGIILSLELLAPCLWQQMTEEYESIEMWTLSGFLGGIFIAFAAYFIRLWIFCKENINEVAGLCEKESSLQAPSLQGTIPLIKEIQAIQPPRDSLAPNVE